MHTTIQRRVTAAAAVAALSLTGGCGGGLSGSSTCADFMKAGHDAQDQVIDTLATTYHKPDFTTPLGRPGVPYYCSTHPKTTLDQFFAGAG